MPVIDMWVYWIISGILLMVAEIFTPGFVLGIFGISCVLTGGAAYAGFGKYVQLGVFGVTSLIFFVFLRKIAYTYLQKYNQETKTNVDALTGKTGVVVNTVKNDVHGEVKLGGEIWYAVPEKNDDVFEVGTKVEVVKVEGNKLFIKMEEK